MAAVFAWLFKRRRKAEPLERADPAAELKRRLAESRAAEPEPETADSENLAEEYAEPTESEAPEAAPEEE